MTTSIQHFHQTFAFVVKSVGGDVQKTRWRSEGFINVRPQTKGPYLHSPYVVYWNMQNGDLHTGLQMKRLFNNVNKGCLNIVNELKDVILRWVLLLIRHVS